MTPSCVSKVFIDIIHIMYKRMKSFIFWPQREELEMSMPMEFGKSFGIKVSIIIDCFEMFIEQPSLQGAILFLSSGYGGRISDNFITENCRLLLKLLPGDIVFADRGFDISESIGICCVEVKIPAFTRGKKQLSPLGVGIYTKNCPH